MLCKGQIITTEKGRKVRFMNQLNGDKEKRWGGVAYEICADCAKGSKTCEQCEKFKVCREENKYYLKCINFSNRKEIPRSQVACLRREALLVEKLEGKYNYLLVPCDTAKVENERCVLYPFKGESWNSFWDDERKPNYKTDILFKEKLFLKLLYAVKEYADKGYVHRDLKPGNITLEVLEDGDVIPHIIDFDWMYISQEFERDVHRNDKLETAYPGGTKGYGQPLSFRRNTDNEVLKVPSVRWDFYSLAMTAYALFEDNSHFTLEEEKEWNPITDSNDRGERYWNNDLIGFKLREMKNTEKALGNEVAMQALRMLLQKMMGINSEYEGQYSNIDAIIADYKNYLMKHYKQRYCKLFECKENNCEDCECALFETKHFKVESFVPIHEVRHYFLQKNKTVIIRMNGDELLEVCWKKDKEIDVKILHEDWKWKNKHVLEEKSSGTSIKISY